MVGQFSLCVFFPGDRAYTSSTSKIQASLDDGRGRRTEWMAVGERQVVGADVKFFHVFPIGIYWLII